ncbi:hypothetical protein M513_09919 [Trichuris suis]|uniref:Protein kinase domain-containing protein n=1 Tax=Trichuris suis TaxID=68888 RepID=A0A085LW51_9BILA|nr:hypothetical protein M513_09919 [Trichuris suis]
MADRTADSSRADSPRCPIFKCGQVLNDRWVITGQIGEGSFGTVYKAKSKQFGIEVAVKICIFQVARLLPTAANVIA